MPRGLSRAYASGCDNSSRLDLEQVTQRPPGALHESVMAKRVADQVVAEAIDGEIAQRQRVALAPYDWIERVATGAFERQSMHFDVMIDILLGRGRIEDEGEHLHEIALRHVNGGKLPVVGHHAQAAAI